MSPQRAALIGERHTSASRWPSASAPARGRPPPRPSPTVPAGERRHPPRALRPLVTLASVLIEAGRAGRTLQRDDVTERLQVSESELREDINVLNVVNFGGGSYVLYAELTDDGEIEVDPEPYSDNFARPARLLPVEAKALVAAIDLIGEHIPEGSLTARRDRRRARRGPDRGRPAHRLGAGATTPTSPRSSPARSPAAGSSSSSTTRPTRTSLHPHRRAVRADQRARGLVRRVLRPQRRGRRPAPLPPRSHQARDRARRALHAPPGGRPGRRGRGLAADRRGGGLPDGPPVDRPGARPLGARGASRDRGARGRRDRRRAAVQGLDYLVREVLKGAGESVVLEPADARDAVREAVSRLAPVR